MIHACLSVYNEESLLRSSLDSFSKYVDKIHVFAGKWRDDKPSNESTMKILEEYNCEIYYKPNLTEIEARNLTFSKVPVGDWIFWIDGDEILVGDMKKMKYEIESTGWDLIITPIFNNGEAWTMTPRLFRQTGDFHLGNKHWEYHHGDKMIWDGYKSEIQFLMTPDIIYLINCNCLRPLDRKQEHVTYRNFMGDRKWIE